MLESAGYVDAASLPTPPEAPDVVVFNTCAVRENADNKLYGNLGRLRPVKDKFPGMQIAVGGCLAQKDRSTIVDKAPWVDVVFGTHNIGSPAGAARPGRAQPAGRGRDPREPGRLSLHAAHSPRLRLQRLGVDLGGLQQHLHVLHRPRAARQGDGPPPRRHPRRGGGARRPGRGRGDPARPERQHLRRRVRRPARLRQAAARLRRDRRPGAGALHQPAPGRVHRRRHRRDGRDAERHAEPAHAAAGRVRPGPEGDAPLLPQRQVPRHPGQGPRADPRRGDHHRPHRRLPR